MKSLSLEIIDASYILKLVGREMAEIGVRIMTATQKIWRDNRSGMIGQFAGNAVLKKLQQGDGKLVHEKGTIFSSADRVYVGRVCSTDSYLQKGIVHFSNISQEQHKSLTKERRDVFYLFITLQKTSLNYWVVPGSIVGKALSVLPVKTDNPTSFIRISGKDGKFYLGEQNISRYHNTISVRGRLATKLKDLS